MAINLRSAFKKTLLFTEKRAILAALDGHQKLASSNVATSKKSTSKFSKFENNIVTSPHSDCEPHGLNLVHRFFESAGRWPNNIALECGITGRKYTYEMTGHLIRRFASALTRAGFRKNEVMAIVSPNIPEFPIVLLGASGAGMPVTLVNPTFTPADIAQQLMDVGVTVLFGVAPMAETLKQVAEQCPTIRQIILLGPPQEGFISFQQMVSDAGDLFNENLDIDIYNDIYVMPHSSGTSGKPKSVMLTHNNIGVNALQSTHQNTTKNRPASGDYQEVYICLLPFFHIYGITAIMQIGFDMGAKLVTLPRFDVQSYLKAIDDHKPTILHTVPTLAQLFVNHPALKMDGFKHVHTIFSAASSLGVTTADKLLEKFEKFELTVQEGYGLTEISPGATMSPIDNSAIGSCGRLLSRTRAKIVDIETGEALGPNQHGEVYVTGPQIMKGYFNNQEATDEMIGADGWLRTGDVAYYDDDGYFYIVDRLKELIKVKGFQVAPLELEEILAKHPAIAEAAVIGIPDEHAGELPRAYVVKKPGSESVSDLEIHAFVESKVPSHKHLKGGIEFCASIPKNNMGKVLRRELRSQFTHQNQTRVKF